MNETLEKIKNDAIRIEMGKLIGLGMKGNESIDIKELNDLIESSGTSGCINALCKTIAAVADILSCNQAQEDPKIKEYVDEWIITALPNHVDVYILQRLITMFNTYRP